MASNRPETKLTYEDFLTFPDDGKRHEIIDGEHFVTPAPSLRHQAIVVNLTAILKGFLDAHPLGRVFVAPADVVLSDVDVVEPDLLFVSSARLDRLTKANVQGAPDLVIEILSPSTRGGLVRTVRTRLPRTTPRRMLAAQGGAMNRTVQHHPYLPSPRDDAAR